MTNTPSAAEVICFADGSIESGKIYLLIQGSVELTEEFPAIVCNKNSPSGVRQRWTTFI
jgi:hypothetical protein